MRVFLLLGAFTLAGCGESFSNEVFEEDTRFLEAVPRRALLAIGAPIQMEGTPNALTAAPAELYVSTYKTALGVDRSVFDHLRGIEALVASPPELRTPTQRIWGPFVHPLDPLEYRFVMTQEGEAFAYAYELRLAGAEADYVPWISGVFEGEERRGEITFHFDDTAALTGAPTRGEAHATYAVDAEGGVELTLELRDFAEAEEPRKEVRVAYTRTPSGFGDFEFAARDEQGTPVELRSRWGPEGAGRADVLLRSTPEVVVSECWDETFVQVWRSLPEVGEEGACAFADEALATRVSLP